MKIKCSTCEYEFEENDFKKCPRCGSIIIRKSGCENCKGCSLWKGCKISVGEIDESN